MILDQEALLAEFDEWTLAKGRSIHAGRGLHSLELKPAEEELVEVRGSVASQSKAGKDYTASLFIDPDSELIYADCSCPVGNYCKHCAALLFGFLLLAQRKGFDTEKLGFPSSPAQNLDPEAAAAIFKKSYEPQVERRILSARGALLRPQVQSLLSLVSPASAKDRRVAGNGARWSIAFFLSLETAFPGPPELRFRRALRFLKKDGLPGRLGAWNPELLSEAVDEVDRAYLERFSGAKDASLSLAEVQDLLRAAPPRDFLVSLGSNVREAQPALLLTLASLEIEFRPTRWDEIQKRPFFGAFLRLSGEALSGRAESGAGIGSAGIGNAGIGSAGIGSAGIGGTQAGGAKPLLLGPGEVFAVHAAGVLFLLLPRQGILAFSAEPALVRLPLEALLNLSFDLSYAEALNLASALQGGSLKKVLAVSAPPAEIELRTLPPRAELACGWNRDFGGEVFVARLGFRYGDRLFEAEPPERHSWMRRSSAPSPGDEFALEEGRLVLNRRDLELEGKMRRGIEALLEPFLEEDPYSYLPEQDAESFPLDLDEAEFFLKLAPSLLDAGITLSYQGEPLAGASRASAGVRLESEGSWFAARLILEAEGSEEILELEDPAAVFERGFARKGGRLWLIAPEDRSALALLLDRWNAEEKRLLIPALDFGRLGMAAELADAEGKALLEERLALGRALSSAFSSGASSQAAAPREASPQGAAAQAAAAREASQGASSQRAAPKKAGARAFIQKEPLPADLKASLRPYQKEGYDRLCFMYSHGLSAILADDMGLGKTVQTLALLARLKEKGELGRVLLLAPLTLLPNWEDEAARFTPGLRVARHHGSSRPSSLAIYAKVDIVLTTYQTLRADRELFEAESFGFLAMDEAQIVKNPDSAAFAAAKAVSASRRLAITGTPVENRPLELWSQFHLVLPGLLDTRRLFESRFSRPLAGGGEKAAEAARALRALVSPFIIRRRKEEVLADLPPKEEIVLRLEMGPKQAQLYEKLRAEAAKRVERSFAERGAGRSAITVFEALLRLRQAAIHPGLVAEGWESAGSVKFDFFEESLLELVAEGHRILVFSQFVEVLGRVKSLVEGLKLEYEYLDGSTRNRKAVLERFKEGEAPLFLLSLKAGGLGVNLPEADYVILLDPWWNPAVESQAVDRAHRIGQTRPVTILKPIVAGTVEEKILELQERKRGMVEELIADSASLYAGLSGEELLELFR